MVGWPYHHFLIKTESGVDTLDQAASQRLKLFEKVLTQMNPPLIRTSILAIVIASIVAATAVAEKTVNTQPTMMNQVTVTATRTKRQLDDVVSSVSVVTVDDVERQMARNTRDLVKYEPGVEVSSDSRFGNGGFNIRGMDENRVKISVDGVGQAKSFGYDRNLQSQRNFFDIENMKQLEIVKGPASNVYGSDAIGGMVAFVTKDPSDYLKPEGDDSYASVKAGYSSADSSFNETITLANRNGDLESMLVYTRRDGKERKSYGGQGGVGESREKADPLNYSSNSLLGKLQYQVNDNNRIGVTGEFQETFSETDMYSQYGDSVQNGPHRRIYTDQSAEDTSERRRLGFFHEMEADTVAFDDMKWSVNFQESVSKQKTRDNFKGCLVIPGTDECGPVTNDDDRLKTYTYREYSSQFDIIFNRYFEPGETGHYLTYGVNFENKEYSNDNFTEYLDDPDRNDTESWMPEVGLKQYGLFAQNEISLLNDRWTITPAIRYDLFEEKIKSRAGYEGEAKDQNYDSWTAGLGTVFEINDTWSVFAQYSQGFATPDMFSRYFNYELSEMVQVLANPDLEPEESDSVEIGVRANNEYGSMELTAFYNDYKNFIEERCVAVEGCSATSGQYQYQNLSEATIKGVEFKGLLWLDEAFGAPRGTRFNTAIAYSRGRGTKEDQDGNLVKNEPLNTISPLTAVFGLGYDAPSQVWGSEVMWIVVAAKKRSDISNMSDVSTGGDQGEDKYAPPGYGIVDLTVYYKPHRGVTINAGIFNMFDKKYWVWDDVRNVTEAYKGINRYTQPGRNYSVSIKWEI